MKTKEEHTHGVKIAKSLARKYALGGLEPPISCLRDRRINHYATEPCCTERYQEVHSLIELWSKNQKGQ